MNILGISAYYHDSAACLVRDGEILAAAQEERFTRKKHDAAFPTEAVAWCLKEAGLTPEQVDIAVFYEKPFVKFERLLTTFLHTAPRGWRVFLQAMPLWIRERIWMKEDLNTRLAGVQRLLFTEHHESHAAAAFFPSPYPEAAFLTVDGVGEWTTTSWGTGSGNTLSFAKHIRFPHSLGLLYSAFTYYLGFKVNSGEYKVMGLAPYGQPKYVDRILENLVDLRDDGSYALNMEYFNYAHGLTMTNEKFSRLFGQPVRKGESRLEAFHMDMARSVQAVVEEAVLRMGRHIHKETGMRHLCLAGGVGLNCVANGKLLREGPFDNIWIQPAAGDAGSALGAALFAWHQVEGQARNVDGVHDRQKGSYLGPRYDNDEIAADLQRLGAVSHRHGDDLADTVAGHIAAGRVIGWFQGRMEFGPRALGARSILGDPRSPQMQETMNLKIKFRESFRPFAPAVLRERAPEYFEIEEESPYMLLVAPVRESRRLALTDEQQQLEGIDLLKIPRSDIPAVTHVDWSARVQTVTEDTNPRFHALLKSLETHHDCPVVINTSFNVRGEPIVNTPEDAWRCFMRTNMDVLVLGDHVLLKDEQPEWSEKTDWREEFELD